MKTIIALLIAGSLCGSLLTYRWGYRDGIDRVHSYVKYTTGIMKAEIEELQKCCSASKGNEVAK